MTNISRDPRVYYDVLHDRFVRSVEESTSPDSTPNTVFLWVSQTGDPTAGWYLYQYFYNGVIDQPSVSIGFTNTAIVQRYAGQGIFLDDTLSLLNGTTQTSVIPMAGSDGYASHAPVGAAAQNFIVSTGAGGNYIIQRVNADRSVNQVSLPISHGANYAIRNGPYTLGSPLTADPQDVLIAFGGRHLFIASTVWNGGDVCQRVVDLYDVSSQPFAPQNQGGTTFCLSGADVTMGALSETGNGTVILATMCSGPGLPVSLCWAPWTGPQAGIQQVFIDKFGTGYVNFDRLGDYTGASTDVTGAGTQVVISGQFSAGTLDWHTWIDRVP